MKSFVALLSIKPHSPSVCPLYATVGAYRTFKYCLPIARLCLTSMVTVTPKKIIEVYNKNWARSLVFNWRPSSTILVKILKHSCSFLLPHSYLGITVVTVLQNTRRSTLGKERGTFDCEQKCEEWMEDVFEKIQHKQCLFQRFVMMTVTAKKNVKKGNGFTRQNNNFA